MPQQRSEQPHTILPPRRFISLSCCIAGTGSAVFIRIHVVSFHFFDFLSPAIHP